MTRLLFPICAALLSTLAGLHLSTHLRQEAQRLARWGEVLPHLHLLMASCAYSLPEAFRLCADGNHPPERYCVSLRTRWNVRRCPRRAR